VSFRTRRTVIPPRFEFGFEARRKASADAEMLIVEAEEICAMVGIRRTPRTAASSLVVRPLKDPPRPSLPACPARSLQEMREPSNRPA
jgi:hypothetical protein